MRRVVITGMSGITALGSDWASIREALLDGRNGVRSMADEWARYTGIHTRLAAPAIFTMPPHWSRKQSRTMGRVAAMAVAATEQALIDAGLLGTSLLSSGRVGAAYGSSFGSPDAVLGFYELKMNGASKNLNATNYIQMMSHSALVNIGIFFGLRGRMIPSSSACTSGSQAIGFAFETIKFGRADIMIAGGGEELDITDSAVFDTLFATSTRNDEPALTPRPYDRDRDGLVMGEGAATLILEDMEHALARGATIYAEVVGYGTNSDGNHVTHPQSETMAQALRLALADAAVPSEAIDIVNGHGTATEWGDIAETHATATILGHKVPIHSIKSYLGHSLGACGSIEAWLGINMMREGWFCHTANCINIDDRCAELDYIQNSARNLQAEYLMSNNFAFGGINTSLIFRNISQSSSFPNKAL